MWPRPREHRLQTMWNNTLHLVQALRNPLATLRVWSLGILRIQQMCGEKLFDPVSVTMEILGENPQKASNWDKVKDQFLSQTSNMFQN